LPLRRNCSRIASGRNDSSVYFDVLTLLSANGGSTSGWPKSMIRRSPDSAAIAAASLFLTNPMILFYLNRASIRWNRENDVMLV